MKQLVIIYLLLGIPSLSFAQKEVRSQLRAGNKEYNQGKYTESEIAYRKALQANAQSTDAAYNLGNSLFMQGKLPEAAEQYQIVAGQEKDKNKLSLSWHNTGNIFLTGAVAKGEQDQSYNEILQKSIEAYKQSLRNNPKDDETRYNLALAQKLLKDSEDKGGGGGQDQKQDQQQKQDQKQDQQQQQDQKQDEKQDQKQEQKQNQQQPQMSKENAQQILDAMMQNEKNTQEKVKEQQVKVQQRKRNDKEW